MRFLQFHDLAQICSLHFSVPIYKCSHNFFPTPSSHFSHQFFCTFLQAFELYALKRICFTRLLASCNQFVPFLFFLAVFSIFNYWLFFQFLVEGRLLKKHWKINEKLKFWKSCEKIKTQEKIIEGWANNFDNWFKLNPASWA